MIHTNWQSSVFVLITPLWYSFSMVGRMPNASPVVRICVSSPGMTTSTHPLTNTDQESNSSPSFITIVPVFSTTANTMTEHSAFRTASVMLVNAFRCWVNSSRASMSSSVRSEGSFSKQSLTLSRTVRL